MKKLILILLTVLLISESAYSQTSWWKRDEHKKLNRDTRKLERRFRESRAIFDATRIPRFATPAKFWEQEYIATMNPKLLRPTPEALTPELNRLLGKTNDIALQPGTSITPWQSRGPNNVGGRTRALTWDPNDATGKKVWAGAATGGLWYNNDITSATSSWVNVSEIWANLSVTCIAFDPNNSQIMYVGTGEGWGSSTSSSRGQGIYKSTDGGKNFSLLSSTSGYYYINDIVVRNESGSSVVYAAVDALYFGGQWNGVSSYGLKRSTNGGTSWTTCLGTVPSKSYNYCVADLEIAEDNRIWIGTRNSPYGTLSSDGGGGRIMYSDNGTTWSVAYNSGNVTGRVEIAVAPSDMNTVYGLFEKSGKADTMVKTINKGSSWVTVKKPVDADQGITSLDFTRGQAWYDLTLSVSPLDSNILICGGIDLFISTNGGSVWKQISKWSNNPGLNNLTCSYVHADIHAAIFYPSKKGQIVFGTDGGVFYCGDITNNPSTNDITVERNNGYIVTQFYAGDLSQTANKNQFLVGAQDNGTHLLSSVGVSNANMVNGGDGGFCFISPSNNAKQICAYVYNNFNYTTNTWTSSASLLSDDLTGKFINAAIWDDNGVGLFSGKDALTLYRVKLLTTPGTPSTLTVTTSGSPGKASAFAVHKDPSTGKSVLLVGTDAGLIYSTSDAWATTPTFTKLAGTLNAGNISSLFRHKTTDTLFVTLSNYGINNIYVSTNGGSTWTAKDGNLTDMPVWSIVYNPSNTGEVLIATELGIYGTADIWATNPVWTEYNIGMGPVKTAQLKYRASDNLLMAVTHGRGVFTSNAWSIKTPIAKFGMNDSTPCENQIITLTDSSLNIPNSYNWKFSPGSTVVFKSGFDSSSKNPQVSFTKAGIYQAKLVVINESGNSTFNRNIKVQANASISPSLISNKALYCKNDSALLIASQSDSLINKFNLSYSWKKNGTVLTGATNDSLWFKYVTNDSNSFAVTLTTAYKCASSKTASSAAIPVLLTYRNIQIYCQDDTLRVKNKPAGGSVNWYRFGVLVGSGDYYKIKQMGTYRAVYVNSGCSSDSSNKVTPLSVGLKSIIKQSVKLIPNQISIGGSTRIVGDFVPGKIEIYNTTGQLLKQINVSAGKSEYTYQAQTAGTVLVIFKSDDSQEPITIGRIVIN